MKENTPKNALQLCSLRNELYLNYLTYCTDFKQIPQKRLFEMIPMNNDVTYLKQSIKDIKNIYKKDHALKNNRSPIVKIMSPITGTSSTRNNIIILIITMILVTLIITLGKLTFLYIRPL